MVRSSLRMEARWPRGLAGGLGVGGCLLRGEFINRTPKAVSFLSRNKKGSRSSMHLQNSRLFVDRIECSTLARAFCWRVSVFQPKTLRARGGLKVVYQCPRAKSQGTLDMTGTANIIEPHVPPPTPPATPNYSQIRLS